MSHAFDYCKTPHKVTKKELINALHQCLMQLRAHSNMEARTLDNRPAIQSAWKAIKKAGHIGFTGTENPPRKGVCTCEHDLEDVTKADPNCQLHRKR